MVGYLNASLAGGILESGRASAGICRHMPQNSMSTGDLLFIGSESGELRRCAFSLGFRRKYLLYVKSALIRWPRSLVAPSRARSWRRQSIVEEARQRSTEIVTVIRLDPWRGGREGERERGMVGMSDLSPCSFWPDSV